MGALLEVLKSAGELSLINSLTVLALFLSYSMLNVCDLSTDGCFTLGAVVGSVTALSGHPLLSIPAAVLSGTASGLVTSLLQTKMGIDSLLSGIIVNTGLYSINIAIMGGSSILNLNKTETVFTVFRRLLENTPFSAFYRLICSLLFLAVTLVLLVLFLSTRLGLAIRATGDNPAMVSSSSINPVFTTVTGLMVSSSLTALSGALLAFSQKSVNVNIGSGMVTIALASLLIGRTFFSRGSIAFRAVGVVAGSFIFRLVYTVALRFRVPSYCLKLVSSIIVIIAISGPYFRKRIPEYVRVMKRRGEGKNA